MRQRIRLERVGNSKEQNAMRKMLMWVAAIGSLAALLAFEAGAMPVAPGNLGIEASDVTPVRDGCGPGFRYSYSRQRCVPDAAAGPPACPPGFRFSEGRGRCVPFERGRPACPPGFRFSESRQRCVPF
jgi:hypothetical protein